MSSPCPQPQGSRSSRGRVKKLPGGKFLGKNHVTLLSWVKTTSLSIKTPLFPQINKYYRKIRNKKEVQIRKKK